jgi:hypothetical protein
MLLARKDRKRKIIALALMHDLRGSAMAALLCKTC